MGLRLWHVRRGVQMALLVLAAAVIWDGLAGPQAGALNLAGVLPWTYWRGLGILALLLVGNLVCSGCPFVLARDLARRWRAPRRLWPRALRTKWIPVGLVLLYLVAYEAFALWDWPAATAVILLGYFAAAILIDTSFRGASFCQYVCPVGQFQFVQSLVSPTEIRARSAAVCSSCRTHDCLRGNAATGARGCELNLLVPAKSGNMDCTLCLDCVRACPHENVVLAPVLPGADLAADRPRSTVGRYSRRPDLAALIAVLVFGSFANAAFMVAPVVAAIDAGNRLLGWSGPWLGAACLGLALTALPFAAVAACVGASGVRPGLRAACRMMPALVPLGAGMWAAHFFFHLATGWSSLGVVVARGLGWTDWRPPGLSPWWADALLPIELVFLGSGLLVTWVIIWRLASAGDDDAPAPRPLRRALPWAVLALALEGFGVWILLQPMEMRGTLFAG